MKSNYTFQILCLIMFTMAIVYYFAIGASGMARWMPAALFLVLALVFLFLSFRRSR